jgi:hypothetical protein
VGGRAGQAWQGRHGVRQRGQTHSGVVVMVVVVVVLLLLLLPLLLVSRVEGGGGLALTGEWPDGEVST